MSKMNIVGIDIGSKNFGLSFFRQGELFDFDLTSWEKFQENNVDFSTYSLVVIEEQMRQNIKAIRIEAQLKMWFKLKWPHLKIKSFKARHKYKLCDKKVFNSQYKRKKWASIFVGKDLPENLKEKFESLLKTDDVADAIVIGKMTLIEMKNKQMNEKHKV